MILYQKQTVGQEIIQIKYNNKTKKYIFLNFFQFVKNGLFVYALDFEEKKLNFAKHNLNISDKENKFELIRCKDLRKFKIKCNCIFINLNRRCRKLTLNSEIEKEVIDILEDCIKITENIILSIPLEFNINRFISIISKLDQTKMLI